MREEKKETEQENQTKVIIPAFNANHTFEDYYVQNLDHHLPDDTEKDYDETNELNVLKNGSSLKPLLNLFYSLNDSENPIKASRAKFHSDKKIYGQVDFRRKHFCKGNQICGQKAHPKNQLDTKLFRKKKWEMQAELRFQVHDVVMIDDPLPIIANFYNDYPFSITKWVSNYKV